jgi:lipoate-protein ligase A
LGSLSGRRASHRLTFTVERRTGTPTYLHGLWPDEMSRSMRVVGICLPSAPVTLVLGSAQRLGSVRHQVVSQENEVAVVHRSTGGGAVLVGPDAQVWVDVWLPRGDQLWDDDVVRSSFWLGRAWRDALAAEGVLDLDVHEGRLERTSLSDLVCFAGVGPGELRWRGRKLVGISQRRNRQGARFQSVSPIHRVGTSLLSLLGADPHELQQLESSLARETTCLIEVMGVVGAQDLAGRIEQSLVRAIEENGG